MSIHPSLKTSSGSLNMHRNVLTRTERIEKLVQAEKFNMEKSTALGLVKVRSIKVSAGKKKKAEGEAADGAAAAPAAGGKAPAGGAGAKPAAGGKPAAAAAGAKPAAGAAGAKKK